MSYESDLREAAIARKKRMGLAPIKPAIVPRERVGRTAQVINFNLERLIRLGERITKRLKMNQAVSADDMPRPPAIKEIIAEVSEFYRVSVTDIHSDRRTADVVFPRQVAMYLCRTITLRSLPEIGRRMGGRDHTTILSGVRKIERLIQAHPRVHDEIQLLIMRLCPQPSVGGACE